MKRLMMLVVACALSMWLFAGSALAHVVVFPREAAPGSYEKFAVRVPTEKDSATVGVEVLIPEGVNITRFEPKPDWTYELERDDTGKIVKVVWTATGPGLGPTEFGEFYMQGRVADDATDLVWAAYQTYEDGEVVAWTGPVGSDKPASVTTVAPGDAGVPGGSGGSGESGSGASGSGVVGMMTLVVSIVAAVLSLFALMLVVADRRARGKERGA